MVPFRDYGLHHRFRGKDPVYKKPEDPERKQFTSWKRRGKYYFPVAWWGNNYVWAIWAEGGSLGTFLRSVFSAKGGKNYGER